MITSQMIKDRFSYHSPSGNQPTHYATIRQQAMNLAMTIINVVPDSREQSLAITKLEEAVMWANKAIALEGK